MRAAHRSRHQSVATLLALGVAATTCGIPTAGGPTGIARSNVPFHLLDPTTTTTTAGGSPPAVGVPEPIFLVSPHRSPDRGHPGDPGPGLPR